jgi:hypothetical protein
MKKAISIVIVTMLMISLVGCGDSSDNTTAQTSGSKENRMTTEEEMSTQEEAGNPIDEPNQEIDEGVNLPSDIEEDDTEEPTTEAADDSQPQGKYTYTIYNGIELSMDVNVDDWIATNKEGNDYFKIYDLAEELGWEGTNLNDYGFAQQLDYHTSDGPVVQFYLAADNEKPDGWEMKRLSMIAYHFTTGAPDYDFYYSMDEVIENHKYASAFVYIPEYNDDTIECIIPGAFLSAASKDDVILIAYLLWEQTVSEGETNIQPLLEKYICGGGAMVVDYRID